MAGSRASGAVGAALASLVSGFQLVSIFPVLHLSPAVCLEHPRLIASMGVHLELLAVSGLCPDGSYLPGPNFAPLAEFTAGLSATALVVGIVATLIALGLGVWVRRSLRSAREWLRSRIRRHEPGKAMVAVPVGAAWAPTAVAVGSDPYRLVQRRGPPLSSC